MTTATEQTNRSFLRAVLSDDDGGYPSRATFVSSDMDGWERVVRDDLLGGRPTVVCTNDIEYLLLPHRRMWPLGLFDRLRRRPRAEVYWRHDDHSHGGFDISVTSDALEHLERQPAFA